MKEFIDLSHIIENDMPVHPYDEKVILKNDKTFAEDGYVNNILTAGMHCGTHIDAPMHLTENENFIESYPIESFTGKTIVIDVSGEDEIRFRKEYDNKISKDDIVLFYTGFEKEYGSFRYYNEHPSISPDLAEFLVSKNVKMVGMDLPSPDSYPFEIHKIFMENGIFIIENLTNLSKLLQSHEIELYAFPLRIKAEASLVRVVAKIIS